MRFVVNIHEIPSCGSVYLYGAGNGGRYMAQLLSRYRKDIRILGFLDTYKRGEVLGLPVYRFEDRMSDGPFSEMILVTSVFWADIERLLLKNSIENYRIIAGDLINEGLLFSQEELEKWRPELQRARELFADRDDQDLFDFLVESHTEMRDSIRNYGRYYVSNFQSIGKQYLDRIHCPSVKTLIDGGVCDGSTLTDFLGALPNLEALHGFEPFIDVYLGGLYAPLLDQDKRISVLPQVLWDKSTSVSFMDCADGRSAVVETQTGGDARTVEALSIDDFAKRPGTGKIDLIKLDVEGSELAVLRGAENTLREHRPQLAVCIYHRKEDLFEIPNYLGSVLKDYHFSLGHYTASFRESVLYAVPNEVKALKG